MARNTLVDLNDHLFAMIEKLGDDEITGEELEQEIQRAHAISGLAKDVVSTANLVLSVARFNDDKNDANAELPKMLGYGNGRA